MSLGKTLYTTFLVLSETDVKFGGPPGYGNVVCVPKNCNMPNRQLVASSMLNVRYLSRRDGVKRIEPGDDLGYALYKCYLLLLLSLLSLLFVYLNDFHNNY